MAFKYEPHDWEPNELIREAELDHIEQGIAEIANNLKTVAETGSYNDLENKPTINGHELTGALDTDSLDLGYTLSAASEETLGGIKIGAGLNATEDGTTKVVWSGIEDKPTKLSEFENDESFTTPDDVQTIISQSGGGGSGGSTIAANSLKFIINARSLSWTSENNLFKTTISVENLVDLTTNAFVLDVLQSEDESLNTVMRDNWNSITRVTVDNKQLTIYATKQFQMLDLQLLVFSTNEGGGGESTGTDISSAVITLEQESFPYDEENHTPKVISVQLVNQFLQEGKDYIVVVTPYSDIGQYSLAVFGIGQYSGKAVTNWSITKGIGSISTSSTDYIIHGSSSLTIDLIVVGDGEISYSEGTHTTLSLSEHKLTIKYKSYGEDDITITLADGEKYSGASCQIHITYSQNQIFGVVWDGSANPQLTRTDASAQFEDPVAEIAVNDGESHSDIKQAGSSPFDNILPWSGMKIVHKDGNEMVSIPKFWYKVTNNGGKGITIQIANYAASGFKVAPTHEDRNDGVGERDWIYVGRFFSDKTTYQSTSSTLYKNNTIKVLNPGTARLNIQSLGKGYYHFDYALYKTIQMLYIVEFAHWDAQLKIGSGKASGYYLPDDLYHTGGVVGSDYVDSGPYIRENIAHYQYRYIADLYKDAYYLSGVKTTTRNSIVSISITIDPSKYYSPDICIDSWAYKQYYSGLIKSWIVPPNYEWAFYPNKEDLQQYSFDAEALFDTYVCDNASIMHGSLGSEEDWSTWDGSSQASGKDTGLFSHLVINQDKDTGGLIAMRLQYLPQSAHEKLT